ncbi:MAG: hypothetical protein QM713_13355 [Arachnia sp.]
MEQWAAVDVDAPLRDLAGPYAVSALGPDDKTTLVLVEVLGHRRGRVRACITDTTLRTPPLGAVSLRAPEDVTLRELVLAHTHCRATAAAVAPRLKWSATMPNTVDLRLGALAAALVLVALIFNNPMLIATSALFAAAAIVRPRLSLGAEGYARIVDGWRDILPESARLMIPAAPPAASSPRPADRVAAVRTAYGSLASDIVYRIENSALFDDAFPPTAEFRVALTLWDESAPNAEELAAAVERTFDAARSAAEERGLDHLPSTARGSAGRAAKAARTALADGPPEERAAARRRVAEILRSLALYYLPPVDPAAPSLIGTRKQIEPAP